MKKPITFLSLIVSVIPFAFYELDGPFGVRTIMGRQGLKILRLRLDKDTIQLKYPMERLNAAANLRLDTTGVINLHGYVFMYDRINGYSIGYAPMPDLYNEQVVNFFLGNNNFEEGSKGGWKDNYTEFKFYFLKETPNLDIEGSQKPLKGCLKEYKDLMPWVSLNAEFSTTSGVKFINKEDGPDVSIEDKWIPFQTVLKRRFKSSKTQDNLIDTISKYKLESSNEKDLMLNSYEIQNSTKSLSDGIFLHPKQADLLNKSKILAVYGVFKNEEGRESLIWGLAEVSDESQPSGKRKFHWMTDIKCDISDLLK